MAKPSTRTSKEDVIRKVQKNHIYINAMTIVNPSDGTLKGIGQLVVDMLKEKGNLLPKYTEIDPDMSKTAQETCDRMAELTPTLYLRINAS